MEPLANKGSATAPDTATAGMHDPRSVKPEGKPATKSILSYQDEVWESAWKRRSAGLISGIFLGLLFGGAIGTLSILSAAVLVPAIGLGSLTMGAVLTTAGAFASFGAFGMLMSGLGDVGVVSGAVAGGLKAQEMHSAAATGSTISAPSVKTPSFNIFKGLKKPNPLVVMTAIACGLGVGLFLISTGSVGFVAPLLSTLFPKAVEATLLAATNVMVSAACTFTFSCAALDFAKLTKNTANLVGHIFSGKIFENEKSSHELAQGAAAPEKKAGRSHEKLDLAFKSDNMKTVVAPIGSYAGKEAGHFTRKVAEEQFHAMDPRNTIAH